MSNGSRIPAAEQLNAKSGEGKAEQALALMLRALALIDENMGPLDVGAHLDLAINRLRDAIGKAEQDPG